MSKTQEEIRNLFCDASEGDRTIKLLKLMQSREGHLNENGMIELNDDNSTYGITKSEAAIELGGVSNKTIQDMISQIDPRRAQCRKLPELTIAGQPIHVNIEEVKIAGDRRPHYFTPETINPIFLQMNISQVGTMLTSLAREYYDENNNIAYGIGAYIYAQLTEYAKDKIRNSYGKISSILLQFMDEIEDMDENMLCMSFVGESTLLEEGELTSEDELMLIIKNNKKSDLELRVDGENKYLSGVYVSIEDGLYIAEDCNGEKTVFGKEQLIRVLV